MSHMERPRIQVNVESGDTVQASFLEDGEVVATTAPFTITAIEGSRFLGGNAALGSIDIDAGWIVEVIEKGDVQLPQELAMIAVISNSNRVAPVKLLGYGDRWQLDGGGFIDHRAVIGWLPWDDWQAQLAPYLAWKAEQDWEAERLAAESAAADATQLEIGNGVVGD